MSHWALVRIEIRNPNQLLLVSTLAELEKAGEFKVQVISKEPIFNALRSKLGNYVQVRLAPDGTLLVTGPDMASYEIKQIARKITQTYTAKALSATLQKLHYKVEQHQVGEKIAIKAVSYV